MVQDSPDSGIDIVVTGSSHVGTAVGAVVLGMGRSGTSAVTRALVTSGFYAGADSDLMAANSGNPAGFWENLAVFRVNEEILERLGGTWFMPPTIEAQVAAKRWAVPELRNVLGQLRAEAGSAPLAVKDPRIGVLLKLWGLVIDEALHPVLVVRNPVEIALSLATRDGTPTAFALASWELHTAGLLEYLHGRVVTVARYAQLARSPETVRRFVGDVAARLSAECAGQVDPGAAPEAIQPELYRNHAAWADGLVQLTARQAELWRFLDGLSPGNHVLDVPLELTRPSRGAAALTLFETVRLRQLRYMEELRAQVSGHESALAEQRQRAVDAEQARDDAMRELARERARADAAGHAHARAEHWLEAIQSSASWRLTAPLRTVLRAFRRARAALLRSARAPANSTVRDRALAGTKGSGDVDLTG